MASGCPLDHLFNRNHEYMLKYECLQCGQRHGTKKEARKHAVTHDQSLQTLLDQWLKNRGRCHVCNRCGREFKSEQIWTIHKKFCGGVLHPGIDITTSKNRLKPVYEQPHLLEQHQPSLMPKNKTSDQTKPPLDHPPAHHQNLYYNNLSQFFYNLS